MIYRVILILLFSFPQFLISHPARSVILQDSTIRKDSSKKNSDLKQKSSEVTIKFNDSKLAPANVRLIFNDFFKKYIGIKESLVYNDSYGAGDKTLRLLDEMKAKSDIVNKETKDARWDIFIQNYNSIRNKIKDIKFISDQRFTFNEISRGLLSFIKQYGLYDKTVYLMYFKDKDSNQNMYWLSDKRDYKNPYLGTMNDSLNAEVKEVWIFE